jgi:DNA-binding MarR family transcriptional regulator
MTFAPVFLPDRSDALLSLALEVAARRVRLASRSVADALGVGYEAYLVLAWLWAADGSDEAEISRAFTPGIATLAVDELVRCGYAERAPGADGGVRVWLTSDGHRSSAAGIDGLDDYAMGGLGASDTRYLLDVISRSVD